jgi:chromosomal replication initiator protein
LVAASALPPEGESPQRRAAVIKKTQEVVAQRFGLTVEDLAGSSRSQRTVYARQIAMFLCRELTDASLPRIGSAFGGRDHTTVLYASTKIPRLMRFDPVVDELVTDLKGRIRESDEDRVILGSTVASSELPVLSRQITEPGSVRRGRGPQVI